MFTLELVVNYVHLISVADEQGGLDAVCMCRMSGRGVVGGGQMHFLLCPEDAAQPVCQHSYRQLPLQL